MAPSLAEPALPLARSQRACRTRAAILDAAERAFAESGFESTRLEDVASAVGIRRASIVYYFADKRALYDAVLAASIAPIERAVAAALAEPGPPPTRVERCIAAWLDAVAARPTFARLLLREMANRADDGAQPFDGHGGGIELAIRRFLLELRSRDEHFPSPIDPACFASAIVGATIAYVRRAPRARDEDARHRDEILRMARRMLGAAPNDTPEVAHGAVR